MCPNFSAFVFFARRCRPPVGVGGLYTGSTEWTEFKNSLECQELLVMLRVQFLNVKNSEYNLQNVV